MRRLATHVRIAIGTPSCMHAGERQHSSGKQEIMRGVIIHTPRALIAFGAPAYASLDKHECECLEQTDNTIHAQAGHVYPSPA